MPELNRRPIALALRATADPVVQWCADCGVNPNTISCCSLVAAAGASIAFAFASKAPFLLLVGVAFCVLRLYLNMLDGMVAIAASQTTKVGEVANELPDRISDVVIFIGMAHSGLCHPFLGYWCAILSLLVAYVGTLGQAVGAHRDFSGPMSKPWRMVALGIGAVATWSITRTQLSLDVMAPTLIVILAGCLVTFTSRCVRLIKATNNLRSAEGGE